MTIKIQTKTPHIPIEIGDLTLRFDMTDDNIQRLMNTHEQASKELEKVDAGDFESVKEVVRKSMDFLLGDGTFDKVYEVAHKSIIIVADYFWSIIDGLEKEVAKRAGQAPSDKVKKYLQHKNKVNQSKK